MKGSILSVEYYESSAWKWLSSQLQKQYRVDNTTDLSNLLLSPQATEINGACMACHSCHRHISCNKSEFSPKFAINFIWTNLNMLETNIFDDMSIVN